MHVSMSSNVLLNWPVQRAYWDRRCRQRPQSSCCWGSFSRCDESRPHYQSPSLGPRATLSCEVCICEPSVESCHHKSQACIPPLNLLKQNTLKCLLCDYSNLACLEIIVSDIKKRQQYNHVKSLKKLFLRRISLKLWKLVLLPINGTNWVHKSIQPTPPWSNQCWLETGW